MTRAPRPALVMLAAGVVLGAVASALLVKKILDYIDNPLALSSTSGYVVFHVGDGYGQYKPFEIGFASLLAEVALVLVVGAVFVAAATYRSRKRASIAASKAAAHTR